jgi:hypothetical protein
MGVAGLLCEAIVELLNKLRHEGIGGVDARDPVKPQLFYQPIL